MVRNEISCRCEGRAENVEPGSISQLHLTDIREVTYTKQFDIKLLRSGLNGASVDRPDGHNFFIIAFAPFT